MQASPAARRELGRRLAAALAGARGAGRDLPTPALVVDLDAFDANAAALVRRAGGTPVRLASKSVRVPALLRRALARDGFAGVLAFTLREALWLHEQDVTDDLLVAYPSVDREALCRLTSSSEAAAAITLVVDHTDHLDAIDAARRRGGAPVRVALDVDAGLHVRGRHVGPKRSPLRDVPAVLAFARAVLSRPGFRLVGVMTYEGQVAGVPDDVPGQRARSLAVRGLKRASLKQLAERRRLVADALAPLVDLELWNAGGTGSVESASADPVVTEVAAGSGLLVPTLFDHYRSFDARPAAFFGVPVVRRPEPGLVTVHGGGLVASGAAGRDRLPTPWVPAGLRLTSLEGAGEVQTPLSGPGTTHLRTGDLVWFRHAKSGELFEHGNHVNLLAGDRFVDRVETYRGHGLTF